MPRMAEFGASRTKGRQSPRHLDKISHQSWPLSRQDWVFIKRLLLALRIVQMGLNLALTVALNAEVNSSNTSWSSIIDLRMRRLPSICASGIVYTADRMQELNTVVQLEFGFTTLSACVQVSVDVYAMSASIGSKWKHLVASVHSRIGARWDARTVIKQDWVGRWYVTDGLRLRYTKSLHKIPTIPLRVFSAFYLLGRNARKTKPQTST